MPVTSNPLLQANSVSSKQAANMGNLSKTPDSPKAGAASFADLYAKQTPVAAAKPDVPAKSARDSVADKAQDKPAAKDDAAASKPDVADSGNGLPTAKADKGAAASGKGDQAEADDDGDGDTVAVAEPVVDPATLAPPLAEAPPALTDAAPIPVQDNSLGAMAAAMPAAPPVEAAQEPVDDVLADLPAVRMALEQSAKAQGTTSVHAKAAANDTPQTDADPSADTSFVNGLAAMVEKQQPPGSEGEGADQGFAGVLDDGLKDLNSANSDTRLDDFANRLANLTQAATPKTANALPPSQPLAMQQSGWTEGLVNRVMYLSSQNLKSAEIQLSPAELGRLDVRVNMTPDQQTQVTFMSAHVGVREALESQQGRLRDMFAEQGMGQLDVNVSDQSRNQDQQQAQQGRSVASTTGSRDGGDDAAHAPNEVEISSASVVLGSSAVDYYA
ncbi:flagellar hook-length control protein FliK [Pseudomonas sp. nanlin1]|uniref:flagellar hook-length control protein FliK n=1 Tax=Pseudomonas sp. nanlin1 TaxID=3040605 RepID=UPI00388EBF95